MCAGRSGTCGILFIAQRGKYHLSTVGGGGFPITEPPSHICCGIDNPILCHFIACCHTTKGWAAYYGLGEDWTVHRRYPVSKEIVFTPSRLPDCQWVSSDILQLYSWHKSEEIQVKQAEKWGIRSWVHNSFLDPLHSSPSLPTTCPCGQLACKASQGHCHMHCTSHH